MKNRSKGKVEGGLVMMDLAMIGILVASFVAIKLLADWCEKQIEK